MFLLRAGIVYVLAYFGLILLAGIRALKHSNSKFMLGIGLIALEWYAICFVGDFTGARFYHIAFFVLIGYALSKRVGDYTDSDVKQLLIKR